MTWDNATPKAEFDGNAVTAGAPMDMDEEAFTSFYHRTARPVWAYLARVSGNAALADDLLQESYLRFLGAARWAEGEDACRRYLFRIATNLLRDHWRRAQPAQLDDLPEGAWAMIEGCGQQVESQMLLGVALTHMKPRDRQLLWLAYAEGCSHREIAEITGLAATSIRILLFRARRKIAGVLRLQNPGPEKGA